MKEEVLSQDTISPKIMSFDHPEFDLLAAFQNRFGFSGNTAPDPAPDTRVLSSCEQVARNAIDVFISRTGTQAAAALLHRRIRDKPLSTATWRAHELHPKVDDFGEEGCVKFIFTMDLLNFSFWSDDLAPSSDNKPSEPFCVDYCGKRWTGYWSLVAGLRRALDQGIPITDPDFWIDEEKCHLDTLKHVFRSETNEEMPMLEERVACLREAGTILHERFSSSVLQLVIRANHSAARLINLVTSHFPCLRDTHSHPDVDEPVHFHKRASIFVADLWACFDGYVPNKANDVPVDSPDSPDSPDNLEADSFDGEDRAPSCTFHDINQGVTAFADYRVPQMLNALGVLHYSPPLQRKIRERVMLESGDKWEVEIRGCTVWGVELLKREITALESKAESEAELSNGEKANGTAPPMRLNSILLDFYLYDTCKEIEEQSEFRSDASAIDDGETELVEQLNGEDELDNQSPLETLGMQMLPHHRVRSIWY